MKAQTRISDLLRKSPVKAVTYGACSEEGSYKAAPACDQYYFCVHSEWSLQSCPNGLHWDNSQRVCNFPDAAGCTGGGEGTDDNAVEEIPDVEDLDPAPVTPASTTSKPKTTTSWADYEYKPWQPPTPPPRPDYDGR